MEVASKGSLVVMVVSVFCRLSGHDNRVTCLPRDTSKPGKAWGVGGGGGAGGTVAF